MDWNKAQFYKFLILIICIFSCTDEDKSIQSKKEGQKTIKEFNIVFPFLNLDDSWQPVGESIPIEEAFFHIEKPDSLSKFNNLWLNKHSQESEGVSDIASSVCYSISRIFYYWFNGEEGRWIEYNDRLDTLWDYKHIGEITDLNQEVFIRGKYQFQYSNNMLKSGQRRYFEANSDSLKKIKGHDLPDLPEI